MPGVGIPGARVMERTSRLFTSGLAIDIDPGAVLQRPVESAQLVVWVRCGAPSVLPGTRDGIVRFVRAGVDGLTTMNVGRLPQRHGLLGRLISDPHPTRVTRIGGQRSS